MTALPADAAALLDRVAKAIYDGRNGVGAVSWFRRDAKHKAPYQGDARAALNLLGRMVPATPTAQHDVKRDQLLRALAPFGDPAP